MAEEKDKKAPVSPVVLVLLAFAGLYNLPKLGPNAPAPAGPTAAAPAAASTAAPPVDEARAQQAARDLELLEPLARLAGVGLEAPADASELFDRVAEAGFDELDAMVALVPDPVRTSNGYQFDQIVDAMERAFESWGLILDRHRFPWTLPEKAPADAAAARPIPLREQPGLLVFRSTGTKRWAFLVFLALETPTRGLDHPDQLLHALRLVDQIQGRSFRPKDDTGLMPTAERVVHILGPTFTGTRYSLRQALDAWMSDRSRPKGLVEGSASTLDRGSRRRIRITAGAASDIPSGGRVRMAAGAESGEREVASADGLESPGRTIGLNILGRPLVADDVRFRTTRNSRLDVLWGMVQYLGGAKRRIALLAESNTGFGQGIDRFFISNEVRLRTSVSPGGEKAYQDGTPIRATVYDFPLYVSMLRREYERKGQLGDAVGRLFKSAGAVEDKADDPTDLRDLVPRQTRNTTIRHDDLTLVQTLTEISRNRYDAVGIFATNPYDAVFLIRLLRRYDPDVPIFTTEADLLLTQSQSIADLRGVLVGSTYPLYPHNRSWTYPHSYSLSKFFFSEGSQAVYNATKLILTEVYQYDIGEVSPLEYGMPFATDRSAEVGQWPPIWISMVGNRGIYPIHAIDASPHSLRSRTGLPTLDPDVTDRPANKSLAVIYDEVTDATPALRRAWFAPWYHEFWPVLYGGLIVTLHLVAMLIALDHGCRAVRDGRSHGILARLAAQPPIAGVVRRLGWSIADETKRGAGLGLIGVAASAVALVVVFAVSRPLLIPAPGSPSRWEAIWDADAPAGMRLDLWRLAAHEAMVVGLTALGLALVSPCRDRLPILRRLRDDLVPILALAVALPTAVAIVYFADDPAIRVDLWLLLERTAALPSGVSPLIPLLFIAAAWASWLDAQTRRRELRSSAELPGGTPLVAELEANRVPRDLTEPYAAFFRRLDWLAEAMHYAVTGPTVKRAPLLIRILLLCGVLLIVAVVLPSYGGPTPDPPRLLWTPIFWTLLLGAALLNAHQIFLLAKCWDDMQGMLRNAARLPLGRAFDRLPARLGRWIFEPPRPEWRLAVLREQAEALKARCADPIVRDALQRAGIAPAEDPRWARLEDALDHTGPDGDWPEAVLLPWLARLWAGLPATYTRSDPNATETAAWPVPPALIGALTDEERDRLRRWAEVAEDFLALRLLLWIGRAQAYLRILMRGTVLTTVALWFAVNSYPFPSQGRLGAVLAVLSAVAAVSVLRVLMGVNRDELISRVTNTLPGRLTLDRDLISQAFTYLVPLVGLVAALSYDVSDLLRSWLDPLFRGQM